MVVQGVQERMFCHVAPICSRCRVPVVRSCGWESDRGLLVTPADFGIRTRPGPGCAPGPASPGPAPHRFLAYTFPSCSPRPAHPAVPGRHDFVEAAGRRPVLSGRAHHVLRPALCRLSDREAHVLVVSSRRTGCRVLSAVPARPMCWSRDLEQFAPDWPLRGHRRRHDRDDQAERRAQHGRRTRGRRRCRRARGSSYTVSATGSIPEPKEPQRQVPRRRPQRRP